jgi:mannose-6-phosphate isomerase
MKAAQDPEFVVEESTPYAELWLGTHPNGMSSVSLNSSKQDDSRLSLSEYVASNPKLHCGNKKSTDLTFLFKVLSINKVLSIQAHPDKKLAERLHANSPHVYKDPNHKPEMAIALSDKVQAMCGFRPIQEIAQHLESYPELCAILGKEVVKQVTETASASLEQSRDTLQSLFKSYLECPDELIQHQLTTLLDRLNALEERDAVQELVVQLAEQFPGDSGIFAPLIFNIVTCRQGEAIFIDANEPHAYITGELIECMACSDNVVRAGLTPKLKDVDTLVEMLTYQSGAPDIYLGDAIDDCTIRYQPPVDDFCVEVVNVPAGETHELVHVDSPSLILVLSGTASLVQEDVCNMDVSFGSSAFCSANTCCTIVAGPDGVKLTRAFQNVFHNDSKYVDEFEY